MTKVLYKVAEQSRSACCSLGRLVKYNVPRFLRLTDVSCSNSSDSNYGYYYHYKSWSLWGKGTGPGSPFGPFIDFSFFVVVVAFPPSLSLLRRCCCLQSVSSDRCGCCVAWLQLRRRRPTGRTRPSSLPSSPSCHARPIYTNIGLRLTDQPRQFTLISFHFLFLIKIS